MNIELSLVQNRSDLREFIHFPARIHRKHAQWLPPVYQDEWSFFNPKKNKGFSHSDTIMILARQGRRTVGRIMGIIHRSYNDQHQQRHARFGYLECYPDQAIAHALLARVEEWARSKGMVKIIGPYGFSDKDPQGLMIEGFEHPPVLAAPCNLAFLSDLVEKEAYTKEVDCLMFMYRFDQELPEVYQRIYQRITANQGYSLLEFKSKKEIKPFILPILALVNETYKDLYGFVAMDEAEMKEFAQRYIAVLDPRFIKVILRKEEVVAFVLGLPSLTWGIQKSKGYLFPIGILFIVWSMLRAKQLDLMLGAVKPGHTGKGLEIMMGLNLFRAAQKAGMDRMEIHLVLETNRLMLAEMEKIGAIPHKKFRIYQKML